MENPEQNPSAQAITPPVAALAVAASPSQHDAARVAPKQEKPARAFISKGEKLTNFGTYAGVDWIFNAAAGVGFAYWGERTATGQKYWSKGLTNFFTNALKPFIKNQDLLQKSVSGGNIFMSIIVGGMATIPPLLALENNKVKKSIVTWLDNTIYGKETVENDPKFAQAHNEILHAPKKDFGIGMLTRGIALSPLLAIILIPETKAIADKYWFHPLAKGTKALAKAIGLQPKSLMQQSAEHSQSAWDYIHASLAMDFGLGPFYAALHSYFYNRFAERKAEHKAARQAVPHTPKEAASEAAPHEVTAAAEPDAAKQREAEGAPRPVITQAEDKAEHHATLQPSETVAQAV